MWCHMPYDKGGDLFQPPGSVATRCLVRCEIHIGSFSRREGSVVFELEPGWTISFHRVLYVPRMRENAIIFYILYSLVYRTLSTVMTRGICVC